MNGKGTPVHSRAAKHSQPRANPRSPHPASSSHRSASSPTPILDAQLEVSPAPRASTSPQAFLSPAPLLPAPAFRCRADMQWPLPHPPTVTPDSSPSVPPAKSHASSTKNHFSRPKRHLSHTSFHPAHLPRPGDGKLACPVFAHLRHWWKAEPHGAERNLRRDPRNSRRPPARLRRRPHPLQRSTSRGLLPGIPSSPLKVSRPWNYRR